MGNFLSSDNIYYEGDRQGADIEVPPRPSAVHEWNGTEWVVNAIKKVEQLKLALDILERNGTSLRAIREILIQVLLYFATTQGVNATTLYNTNPAFKGLKDLDAEATTRRAEIRELS